MNREIKFRGKRVDNNEWVYGYYFTTPLTIENFGAGHLGDGIKRYCISTDMGVVYAVNPETVGQFTGKLDANKKEIYEGDIVKVTKFDDEDKNCTFVTFIEFYEGSWVLYKSIDDELDLYWTIFMDIEYNVEVIGNIHDNPELLKVRNE